MGANHKPGCESLTFSYCGNLSISPLSPFRGPRLLFVHSRPGPSPLTALHPTVLDQTAATMAERYIPEHRRSFAVVARNNRSRFARQSARRTWPSVVALEQALTVPVRRLVLPPTATMIPRPLSHS